MPRASSFDFSARNSERAVLASVLKGAALATLGTYLWYLGTNTQTNRDREAVEGPGVRRRNILLVVILQVGAANFRSGTGRICTDEERKELVTKKLEKKGFDKERLNF